MRIQTVEATVKELLIIDRILDKFGQPKDKTIPLLVALIFYKVHEVSAIGSYNEVNCLARAEELVNAIAKEVSQL